jgi:SAM-dependent methyltransferase
MEELAPASDRSLRRPSNVVECMRLQLLAEACDARTIRHLRDIGVSEGWRCLEAGAGTGSVALWLARQVGGGTVVATDIDTRCLAFPGAGNVTVLRHDLTIDSCPGDPFDLIHSRDVLLHLPNREEVLNRLVTWLLPGGWLVVEDAFILPDLIAPPLLARLFAALAALLAEQLGSDYQWALTLPGPLRSHGLVQTGGTVYIPPTVPAGASEERVRESPVIQFLRQSFEQVGPALIDTGLVTDREVGGIVDLLHDPASITYGFGLVSAWGRRRYPEASARG